MSCGHCGGPAYVDRDDQCWVCRECGARAYVAAGQDYLAGGTYEPEPDIRKGKGKRKRAIPKSKWAWQFIDCADCGAKVPKTSGAILRCKPCRQLHWAAYGKAWNDAHWTPRACLRCEQPIPKGSTARYHPDCRKERLAEQHRQYQAEVRAGERVWSVRWFDAVGKGTARSR